MDKIERKLQRVIYAFMMSVIIIVAAFAVTIYYYETKEISEGAVGEGLFAMAFVDENVGSAPLNASFSSLLFNFEGTPIYHWDFGDGNTSNEISPTHNYTEEGEYTCNLTITDSAGGKVTTSVKILVVANNPPTMVLIVTPNSSPRPHMLGWVTLATPGSPGDLVFVNILKTLHEKPSSPLLERLSVITCEAQPFDPEGDEIVWYEWELQQPIVKKIGGTQDWPKFVFSGENLSTLIIPQMYVLRKGSYNIRLTVTDSKGNKGSDAKPFAVDLSNIENRKWAMKNKWDDFWKIDYANLAPQYKTLASTSMWSLLGPVQKITDAMMERLLSSLPENISSQIRSIYDGIWIKQELTYKKLNYNPPSMPSDPFPADNNTNVSISTNLSWNCSDPDGHAIKYDIYFGATSPPPLVISGHSSGSSFELGLLQSNTTYYWKIVAEDAPRVGSSKSVTGPIWGFTTQ